MSIIYDITTYITIKCFTRKLLNQGCLVVKLKSSPRKLQSPPWRGWPLPSVCVTNDHIYVPFVVTIRSFPHSRFIRGFVTRLVPHVKHEFLPLPMHPRTPPVFSWVRVVRSLVFCLVFCRLLLASPFAFFIWTLYCLSFFTLRFLMTPLVSSNSLSIHEKNDPQNLSNCFNCIKSFWSKSTHNMPRMLYISVLST